MSSPWICYFGYGSLVNRNTRPQTEDAINATLKGWQRVWNHRANADDEQRRCTSLSIEQMPGEIEGVLVRIPEAELSALDQREFGYQRLSLSNTDFRLPEGVEIGKVYVYQSLSINRHMADEQHPIMQSYVDCVMAGYQARFGGEGVHQLLRTTRGWEKSIMNDRMSPKYPRSVVLPDEQLRSFDKLLTQIR